jgi:prepilin-type processing-associated H-X9-DG protein/prepilin-type N-terminal cleavage/methylation domain-containing protein
MRRADGLTLIELLAAIVLATIIVSFVYASGLRTLEEGRSAQCISNLRQWGVALGMYAQDHDGRIPRRGQGVRPVEQIDREDDWFNCLPPYLGLPSFSTLAHSGQEPKPGQHSLFICPSAQDLHQPHFLAYGMNMYLSPWNRPDMHRLQQIPAPSQLAFLADGPGGWSSTVPSSQAYSVLARHLGRANVAFVDGHVQSFSGRYLGCGEGNTSKPDIRWQTETSGVNQISVP